MAHSPPERSSSSCLEAGPGQDQYKFGDITRGLVGKFQETTKSLTGKEKYEFGDFSRWFVKDGVTAMDQAAKLRLSEFTNKPSYQFGDVTREIISRFQNGQYTGEDIWLFLKIVAMIGINLQPIASVLPVKVVLDMLNISIAQGVGGKVVSVLSTEVDARMKEYFIGDRDYKLGDKTKEIITGDKHYKFGDLTKNAVAKFTGQDEYTPGDITKALLAKSGVEEQEDDTVVRKTFLEMNEDAKQEFEAWDKGYLQSKQKHSDDSIIPHEDYKQWDEKYLAASKD